MRKHNDNSGRTRLSHEREAELNDLATSVIEVHCPNGSIDPEKIIDAKDIPLFFDHYEDAFDGLIECVDGQFYIHCNLDRENFPKSARGRFTLAHELGHYFIDEHRNNLASGRVSPHPSFSDKSTDDLLVEREADFFASRLLMPDALFQRAIRKHGKTLKGIVGVAEDLNVSLSCAAIRFITSGIHPSVIIKWSADGYAWRWCSKHFWNLGYRTTIKSIDKLPDGSATSQCLNYKGLNAPVFEAGSTASAWFPWVHQGGSKNVILREEARSLGRYGTLTLLTLHADDFPAEVKISREYELGERV
jgi:hypothetical protein